MAARRQLLFAVFYAALLLLPALGYVYFFGNEPERAAGSAEEWTAAQAVALAAYRAEMQALGTTGVVPSKPAKDWGAPFRLEPINVGAAGPFPDGTWQVTTDSRRGELRMRCSVRVRVPEARTRAEVERAVRCSSHIEPLQPSVEDSELDSIMEVM